MIRLLILSAFLLSALANAQEADPDAEETAAAEEASATDESSETKKSKTCSVWTRTITAKSRKTISTPVWKSGMNSPCRFQPTSDYSQGIHV